MNATEHSFPLPEIEAHKLDHFQEAIQSSAQDQPKPAIQIRNLWTILGVLATAALAAWLWTRKA